MGTTKIEWTDATWNPVTGCTPIAAGCKNCWAKRMVGRLAGRYGYSAQEPFRPTLHADRMMEPLLWRKPRRIAVALMGDLFHAEVPNEFIDRVFAVMAFSPRHTFQLLTKRPDRAAEWFERCKANRRGYWCGAAGYLLDQLSGGDGGETPTPEWIKPHLEATRKHYYPDANLKILGDTSLLTPWPLPNVWLGCSFSNQKEANAFLPQLVACPAAVLFASIEPLLERIEIPRTYLSRLGWVIVGGESGPGARPMHPDWARSIRDQCQAAGVPFFMKQMAKREPIPTDLQIREYPHA